MKEKVKNILNKTKGKFNNVLKLAKENKLITTISICLVVLIIATIILIIVQGNRGAIKKYETVDTSYLQPKEYEDLLDKDEGEEILLNVDTGDYQENEEVAIITDEETGKVTIISTSDPDYEQKTAGKKVTIGQVTNGGVKTKTNNEDLKDLSKKSEQEQKDQIEVTPPPENRPSVEPSTAPQEEPTQTPEQSNEPTTSTTPSNTPSTEPSTAPRQTNEPTTSTTPSNTPSNTPSTQPSTTPSQSTTPKHTPFTESKRVRNTSLEATIVGAIREKINESYEINHESFGLAKGTATATSQAKSLSSKYFTYRNTTQIKNMIGDVYYGTYYVYCEDVYMWDSTGENEYLYHTNCYVYDVSSGMSF